MGPQNWWKSRHSLCNSIFVLCQQKALKVMVLRGPGPLHGNVFYPHYMSLLGITFPSTANTQSTKVPPRSTGYIRHKMANRYSERALGKGLASAKKCRPSFIFLRERKDLNAVTHDWNVTHIWVIV